MATLEKENRPSITSNAIVHKYSELEDKERVGQMGGVLLHIDRMRDLQPATQPSSKLSKPILQISHHESETVLYTTPPCEDPINPELNQEAYIYGVEHDEILLVQVLVGPEMDVVLGSTFHKVDFNHPFDGTLHLQGSPFGIEPSVDVRMTPITPKENTAAEADKPGLVCSFPRDEMLGLGYYVAEQGKENEPQRKQIEMKVSRDLGNSMHWNTLGSMAGGTVGGKKYNEIECYEKAIEHDENNTQAWNNLAGCGGGAQYSEKECWEKCLTFEVTAALLNSLGVAGGGRVSDRDLDTKECYEEALKTNINYVLAWNNLANNGGGVVNGTLYSTEECLGQSIKRDPSNAQAFNNLGVLGGKLGDEQLDPQKCYEKAVELDPFYACAWNNLGVAVGARDKIKAQQCFQKAAELKPGESEYWNNLGIIGGGIVNERNYDSSECFLKATDLGPVDGQAWCNLGDSGGTVEHKADECIRKALELSPDIHEAWLKLCTLGGGTVGGTFYNSQQCCARALELNEDYGQAWNNLGALRGGKVNDKFYNEKECFAKAADYFPDVIEPWFNLAVAGGIEKDPKKNELACWEQVVLLDPSNSESWCQLGRLGGFHHPKQGFLSGPDCLNVAAGLKNEAA